MTNTSMTNEHEARHDAGVVPLQPGRAAELERGVVVGHARRLLAVGRAGGGPLGPDEASRRRMRSTHRCTKESRPTPWLRTTSMVWPITADPERAISAPISVRSTRASMSTRCRTALTSTLATIWSMSSRSTIGLQVDPGDELVEVGVGEHGVDVDAGQDPVDVHPFEEQIDVELVEQLVEVDAGEQCLQIDPIHDGLDVDLVDDRLDVDLVDERLHVDPVDDGFDVDLVDDRLDVDPLDDLVDVEGTDDARRHLVGDRLHDLGRAVEQRVEQPVTFAPATATALASSHDWLNPAGRRAGGRRHVAVERLRQALDQQVGLR